MNKLCALVSGIRRHQPKWLLTANRRAALPEPDQVRQPVVSLLQGYRPRGRVERYLKEELSDGPLPLDVLLDRASQRLIRTEIVRGGWAVDAGIWGLKLYRQQAAEAIRSLNGTLFRVEQVEQ